MSKAFALVMVLAGVVRADDQCHVLDVSFTPQEDHLPDAKLHMPPQIVVWLEDAQGNYVDTLFITQSIGTFGLGNRPGRFDFNSGPLWPYGRRVTTFPVWSHKDKPDLAASGAYPFPELEFQKGGSDSNLSNPLAVSSHEPHYCRPLNIDSDAPLWQAAIDTGTCATPLKGGVGTDKGEFSPSKTTGYPPRVDVSRAHEDSASVDMFPLMNPFDGVSQATPMFGEQAQVTWPIPSLLPPGDYTIFVEVAKELDYNATFNPTTYPAPVGIGYADNGLPYRGQPSVVYKVPIAIGGNADTVAMAAEFAGYGDPDGLDGNLRVPDTTITTDQPGSGGARLQLVSDAQGMYRVLVDAHNVDDTTPPSTASEGTVVTATPTGAQLTFVAPDDSGHKVRGYDIRYRAAEPITDANFATSTPLAMAPKPDDPGQVQSIALDGLLPQTDYYVGIRAFDECHNNSPLEVIHFTTADNSGGEVDACFVATAAYGSVMANDVGMLRRLRDRALRNNVLGELFVETYYTFGPAFANVVDRSDALRTTARAALGPLVDRARATTY